MAFAHRTQSCFLLLVLLGCLFTAATDARDDDGCMGAPVVLRANSSFGVQTFSAMPALFGTAFSRQPNQTLDLALASPQNACAALAGRLHSKAVLAVRGNCSFADKARHAADAHASLLIVVDTEPGCMLMSGDNSTAQQPQTQVLAVSAASGQRLQAMAAQQATVTAWWPELSPLDGSQVLLWLLAVATVAAGSCWASSDMLASRLHESERQSTWVAGVRADADGQHPAQSSGSGSSAAAGSRQGSASPRNGGTGTLLRRSQSDERRSAAAAAAGGDSTLDAVVVQPAEKPAASANQTDVMVVTPCAAVAYLFVASSVLVLLFWLIDYINTLLVVLFCLAAQSSLIAVLRLPIAATRPKWDQHLTAIPRIGSVPTVVLAVAPFVLALTAAWLTHREATWGWAFQDLMGVSLVLSCLRGIRVTSLKVAALLLGLMCLYDVWWVFLQPRVSHSSSVMVEVATGGTSHQPLPIVLLMPALRHFREKGYAVLGLGDMALPGILASFCRCWDTAVKPRPLLRGHFLPAMAAYGFGLLLTYIGLIVKFGSSQGQPALFYIVPSMLGAVMLSARLHGEFSSMWCGHALDSVSADDQDDRQRLLPAAADAAGQV